MNLFKFFTNLIVLAYILPSLIIGLICGYFYGRSTCPVVIGEIISAPFNIDTLDHNDGNGIYDGGFLIETAFTRSNTDDLILLKVSSDLGLKPINQIPIGEVTILQVQGDSVVVYTNTVIEQLQRYVAGGPAIGKPFHVFWNEADLIIGYLNWNPKYVFPSK